MSLRARFDKLDARERKLLNVLLGVFGGLLLLLVPYGISGAVSARRDETAAIRELIDAIQAAQGQVAERKARHDALVARYAKPAPPLAGFIEEAARAHGLTPESQDRPDVPHGKRFTERLTVVKMHKVGMLALAQTLEQIEQSGHPVSVTRLNIKPRTGEPDSYEVELGVSAFDRKGEAPPAAPPAEAPTSAPEAP